MSILNYMLNVHSQVYVPAQKTYVKISPRYLSVEANDDIMLLSTGDVGSTGNHSFVKSVEGENLNISQEEHEFAVLLDALAPKILPLEHSVVLTKVPDEVFERLFDKRIKFMDKVNDIKPYLAQPARPALVAKLPTPSSDVIKHDAAKKEAIELLYVLRCVVAVFPEYNDELVELASAAFSGDYRNFDDNKKKEIMEYLTKLRGVSAPVSAVVSAALKLFYTVDGMAFDDFSVTLTALEWETITINMNQIRIKYAERIRDISTEKYHFEKSKESKLKDKEELDEEINKDRHPLVKILKLTLEDFHMKTQTFITSNLDLKSSLKKVRFDRKALLAKVKSEILRKYRQNPTLDVVKYAKITPIAFSKEGE